MTNETTPTQPTQTDDDIFGPVISTYTRTQAIDDGVLVDVTEWASSDKGFHGGFTCPVAMTQSVWAAVEVPERSRRSGDTRGRAHDVLWMASLTARRNAGQSINFAVRLGRKTHVMTINAGPGDQGEFVITIGYPEDF